jgi:hypothetical protein
MTATTFMESYEPKQRTATTGVAMLVTSHQEVRIAAEQRREAVLPS